MDEILADCEGAYWYLDDVGVVGTTVEEHDARLEKILQRFKETGVVLNVKKCKIRVTQFDFLGYRISSKGIRPSTAKQEAIMSFRKPTNDSEVRSFLGLANYMAKFVPNLATIDEPLRKLLHKETRFVWGREQELAFHEIKARISNAGCLGFYNIADQTSVVADASPYALGGVLIQTNADQESRVICFASKSLTDTEKRYCQTEREALALVWVVERFQIYLIGREFDLITDCKALTFLFNPTSRPCARIERWVLRLQGFRYRVVFTKGKDNIADALSRLTSASPQPFDPAEELTVCEIGSAAAAMIALRWSEIKYASKGDEEIQQIVKILNSEDTVQLPLPFRLIATELCIVDDVLMRGDRIIIPQKLQQRVLQLGHEGHPGARIMKEYLRASVWWPKLDKHIEEYVRECRGCTLVSAPNPPEPMMRKELPAGPWEQIAIDFLGPLPDGENLLVCVDYYSRYLEVIIMDDISTTSTIAELLTVFSRYGTPVSIRADNGPQFSSTEFKDFCMEYGIKLVSTIPYWPAMNGEVERQNRSILKRIRIAHSLGKDWKTELRQYILMYHSAKQSTTGKSPAELMFNRKVRTKLPRVPVVLDDTELRDHDCLLKEKGKVYSDTKRKAAMSDITVGDTVIAKRTKKINKLDTVFSPEEYTVVDKKGSDVIIRSTANGKDFRRNAAHLKMVSRTENDNQSAQTVQEKDNNKNDLAQHSRPPQDEGCGEGSNDVSGDKGSGAAEYISKRRKTEPSRLKDYITY
ncbi:uncharacterized protein K02A2.6-like [Uranotaenia lowii]|uniref:uncharacterized protein K02A2.6-like n=1 Tax=Uranotaenia lowii TaxID=190385 RepID=UPI0024783FF7|nr:uncharacterized protein K02A2.6-like [Uranotaenia lowii]